MCYVSKVLFHVTSPSIVSGDVRDLFLKHRYQASLALSLAIRIDSSFLPRSGFSFLLYRFFIASDTAIRVYTFTIVVLYELFQIEDLFDCRVCLSYSEIEE